MGIQCWSEGEIQQMTLFFSMSNIFLLLGALYVSLIHGKYYLVETEGAAHTPIKHDSDYGGEWRYIDPCEIEKKEGRNKFCENEPFPNRYDKSNNAEAVKAKNNNYWTYNKKTKKCEQFKGEGYWCKDEYLSKNMYESEDDCRMFCLLEFKEANGTITKITSRGLWFTCHESDPLPKEPCEPLERWTLTKEKKCVMYEAMGIASIDELDKAINRKKN